MPIPTRPARATDLDSLVAIEEAAFDLDRISRRSFRGFLERSTAALEVVELEGEVAGYFLVLSRRRSGLARLYSIAVHPRFGQAGLGRILLQAAENSAFHNGRIALRLEVREDNERAIALYRKCGYREWGRYADYYADHTDALRFEKILRGETELESTVRYFPQSEDFTCGPACLIMALAHFHRNYQADAVEEIRIWREATTIFMLSGPGGCGPFGLALAAHKRGLQVRLIVSHTGPLFLDSVRSPAKRRVMELAQTDLRQSVEALEIPVEHRPFGLEDLRSCIADGGLAMVLISAFQMLGAKVPHWVLVIADTGSHLVIHDPYVEHEQDETTADSSFLPISYDLFLGMAQFGKQGLRACVLVHKETQS
ncbi:MAG: GNAT family N-acetyltransferase/peptidase C39 family protein [Planctomycetes bacterium]|nr:GNAT family N-acetyltransferase/peptidase C39 family protein [Planctomycetota bacterium]